jgi:hypothetical protein
VQIFFFYLHERIWHKIKWGRIKHPLSEFDLNRELREEDKKIIEEQLKVLGYLD